jgi:hypothetical protein
VEELLADSFINRNQFGCISGTSFVNTGTFFMLPGNKVWTLSKWQHFSSVCLSVPVLDLGDTLSFLPSFVLPLPNPPSMEIYP